MNTIADLQTLLAPLPVDVKDLPYFQVREYPNDGLQRRCAPFLDPVVGNDEIQKLIAVMEKTMMGYQAAGLAGPQVGIFYRIMVVRIDGQAVTMINPVIKQATGVQEEKEGCLSFPGLFIKVKRAANIEVEYMDRDGKWHIRALTSIEAVAVQHEIDHLDGKTFLDRIPVFYRRGILQKMQVAQRRFRSDAKLLKAAQLKALKAAKRRASRAP